MVRMFPDSELKRMGFSKKEDLSKAIKDKRNEFKTLKIIAEEIGFISTKSLRCYCNSNEIDLSYTKECCVCKNKFNSNLEKTLVCSDECKKIYRSKTAKEKRTEEKYVRIVKCGVCNEKFEAKTVNSVYCSKTCYSRTRTDNRKIRARTNGKVDSDISLYELYCKHDGICYICGKSTNWDDKKPSYRTMVCGNDYPTIDHVIPLKSGGTHSWENVKLACRGCNCSKQGANLEEYLLNRS